MIDNENNEDQVRSCEFNGNLEEQSKFKENNEENVNDAKKNRMPTKVDSENVSDSNEYFQKIKTIEILVSFWGHLQIGNSIIIYEVLTTNSDGSKDSFVKQSLAILTLTSIGLTISIFLRHIAHLKWKRSKLFWLKDETIWSSGYWKVMVIEAIFATIAPQFFLNNIVISEHIAKYDVIVEYEVNTVLCSFVWMKCYVIVRALLTMTKFLAPRAQRIWKNEWLSRWYDVFCSKWIQTKSKYNLNLHFNYKCSNIWLQHKNIRSTTIRSIWSKIW